MHFPLRIFTVMIGLGAFVAHLPAALPVSPNAPVSTQDYQAPIRVACVGDSITYGSGTGNPALESYPAQLGRILGTQWKVSNYGVSGATLLNAGDKPYQKEGAFQKALEFQPNVVVIMLGTNDSKPQNWKSKAQFAADYKDLVEKFKALPDHPRVFISHPVPVAGAGNFGINEPAVREEIPMIDKVAQEENAGVIDLHGALAGAANMFPDRVHPNTSGAALMAKAVYRTLTGKSFMGQVPAPAPAPAASSNTVPAPSPAH